MAFAYSTTIQDRIALAVFGTSYASLAADEKKHIDGTWTTGSLASGAAYDAFTRIGQIANWFEQAGASSAPQAWEHWLVAETAEMLAKVYRPERHQQYALDREHAIDTALDSFTLRDSTGTFSSSNLSQTASVNGIRFDVLNKCARRKESGTNSGMRRRLFPPIDDIDAQIQWTLNHIWNMTNWNFRRRQVTVTIKKLDSVTNATWTESTRTLTSTGAFTSLPSGFATSGSGMVLITGGTGVVNGFYPIESKTSNDAVVLRSSIAVDNANLTAADIAVQIAYVTVRGLRSGETPDSVASRELYYSGTYMVGGTMRWADPSQTAQALSYYGSGTGQPGMFSFEPVSPDKIDWKIMPFPNGDYNLTGAVYVKGPGSPSSATDTTVFSKFPTEFFPIIRDMVFARVLMMQQASDAERIWARAVDAVTAFLPEYTDQGAGAKRGQVDDAYRDWDSMIGAAPYGIGRRAGGGSGGLL